MAKSGSRNSLVSRGFVSKFIILLIIAGLAAFGGIYYKKYQDLKTATPEKLQEAQVQDTISEVSKLYALPSDEQPDVATVKDKEALKQQYPFFDQAENDDVVLIYKEAKLAILYRPATKQLIKVGPVNVESGVAIKVIGSEADRAAVEGQLKTNNLAYTSGSAKTAVTGITVVDVKGTNADQATRLADVVKGRVGTLPTGEDKPDDVDLLIIVGPTTP